MENSLLLASEDKYAAEESVPNVYEDNGKRIINSLNIANVFKKEHCHVLSDIRDLIDSIKSMDNRLTDGKFTKYADENFIEASYEDTYGRDKPMFLLTRSGIEILAAKYSSEGSDTAVISALFRMAADEDREAHGPTCSSILQEVSSRLLNTNVELYDSLNSFKKDVSANLPSMIHAQVAEIVPEIEKTHELTVNDHNDYLALREQMISENAKYQEQITSLAASFRTCLANLHNPYYICYAHDEKYYNLTQDAWIKYKLEQIRRDRPRGMVDLTAVLGYDFERGRQIKQLGIDAVFCRAERGSINGSAPGALFARPLEYCKELGFYPNTTPFIWQPNQELYVRHLDVVNKTLAAPLIEEGKRNGSRYVTLDHIIDVIFPHYQITIREINRILDELVSICPHRIPDEDFKAEVLLLNTSFDSRIVPMYTEHAAIQAYFKQFITDELLRLPINQAFYSYFERDTNVFNAASVPEQFEALREALPGGVDLATWLKTTNPSVETMRKMNAIAEAAKKPRHVSLDNTPIRGRGRPKGSKNKKHK